MSKIKQNDYVYYKDGKLATVDFVFQDAEAKITIIALTFVDTGDEIMCEEFEITLANNEATELLYDNNTISKEPLDKTQVVPTLEEHK